MLAAGHTFPLMETKERLKRDAEWRKTVTLAHTGPCTASQLLLILYSYRSADFQCKQKLLLLLI